MKFMYPAKRPAWFVLTCVFALLVAAGSTSGQTRKKSSTAKKPAPTRKAVVKKQAVKTKDARKDTRTASRSKAGAGARDTRSKNARTAKAPDGQTTKSHRPSPAIGAKVQG